MDVEAIKEASGFTCEEIELKANLIEYQAISMVFVSTRSNKSQAPDMDATDARYAADLFAVVAGLRASLGPA